MITKVTVSKTTITLPTYLPAAPDKNPMFLEKRAGCCRVQTVPRRMIPKLVCVYLEGLLAKGKNASLPVKNAPFAAARSRVSSNQSMQTHLALTK